MRVATRHEQDGACDSPRRHRIIGRKGSEQGLSGYVAPVPGLDPYPAGVLTVALGGFRLLSTYVQQRAFYAALNVAVFEPRHAMTLQQKLFYAMWHRIAR